MCEVNREAANLYNREYGDLQGGIAQHPDICSPSLLADIAQKLETVRNITSDTSGHLTSLRDRLFGAPPPDAPSANGADKPLGQANEVLSMLESLIDQARYAREEASQLNSRI